MYNPLQLCEVFHLELLRWLGRKVEAKYYALKGGGNLRFFFNSFRYSEDIDLDIWGVEVRVLRDLVMGILSAQSFKVNLKPYGIEMIAPPDITRAKQTETTQRFKVHLITSAGEDLVSKLEFSRRGMKREAVVQPVSETILRAYRLPPLLVPHYDIQSTVVQKVDALACRSVIQARDLFDLYILSSQCKDIEAIKLEMIGKDKLTTAYEHVFEVTFEQFRDTVISYLSTEDQAVYKTASVWDEVRLRTAGFIDELRCRYA